MVASSLLGVATWDFALSQIYAPLRLMQVSRGG